MVIPDPENNNFYLLSDRAREAYRALPSKRYKDLLWAITRALELGTTDRNPIVYERHDPDADPHRTLNVYWQDLHISFRTIPNDPRYEITHIEITPDSHPPTTFSP